MDDLYADAKEAKEQNPVKSLIEFAKETNTWAEYVDTLYQDARKWLLTVDPQYNYGYITPESSPNNQGGNGNGKANPEATGEPDTEENTAENAQVQGTEETTPETGKTIIPETPEPSRANKKANEGKGKEGEEQTAGENGKEEAEELNNVQIGLEDDPGGGEHPNPIQTLPTQSPKEMKSPKPAKYTSNQSRKSQKVPKKPKSHPKQHHQSRPRHYKTRRWNY